MDRSKVWRLVNAAVLTALILGGCNAQSGRPRSRFGSTPYPGVYTLYGVADPQNLGKHSYDGWHWSLANHREANRGVVYTCRAGFIDIAHLRIAVDWARYCQIQIKRSLQSGVTERTIKGEEPSPYHITFHYPDFWDQIDADQKDRFIHELSIRMGIRMAALMTTWHELVTFYGYTEVPPFSQKESSFSYDDMTAHAVGFIVAEQALRHTSKSFDDAVSEAIRQQMIELAAVSPEQTREAIEQVRNQWWLPEWGTQRRRHLDPILDDNKIEPWLVRGMSSCNNAPAKTLTVPTLTDVFGRDCSGMYRVRIEPKTSAARHLTTFIKPRPLMVDPDLHLSIIMKNIREECVKVLGPYCDQPYDPPPAN